MLMLSNSVMRFARDYGNGVYLMGRRAVSVWYGTITCAFAAWKGRRDTCCAPSLDWT